MGLKMPTKDLRFAVDEKGYKALAPTLIGKTLTYWEGDSRLLSGRVTAAEVKRDRYGNPYIEVEFGGESPPPVAPSPEAPDTGASADGAGDGEPSA